MSDKYRIDPNVRTHGMGTGAKLTEWDQLRAENEQREQRFQAWVDQAETELGSLRAENERQQRRARLAESERDEARVEVERLNTNLGTEMGWRIQLQAENERLRAALEGLARRVEDTLSVVHPECGNAEPELKQAWVALGRDKAS